GIDLEELAVLGAELQLAGQALVIDVARLGRPAERPGELRLAAGDRAGVADAPEELADVAGVQAEVEVGGLGIAPAALGVERRIGARELELVDAPVGAIGHRKELEAAEVLAA